MTADTPQNDDIYEDDDIETSTAPPNPDDRFRDLAEKIQVGDAEEGAQALQEVIKSAQVGRRSVRDELADMQMETENQAALGRFTKRYKQVAEDPHMAQVATSILSDEMVNDLRAAGVKEDDLAPARGNLNRLAAMHGYARRKGLEVWNADDLLEETGRTLNRKFGIRPAPARSRHEVVQQMAEERGIRGDGTSRRDPAMMAAARARSQTHAGPRRAPVQSAASAEAARSDRARDWISQQRKARGFPVAD